MVCVCVCVFFNLYVTLGQAVCMGHAVCGAGPTPLASSGFANRYECFSLGGGLGCTDSV